jgi:hypothetical protein
METFSRDGSHTLNNEAHEDHQEQRRTSGPPRECGHAQTGAVGRQSTVAPALSCCAEPKHFRLPEVRSSLPSGIPSGRGLRDANVTADRIRHPCGGSGTGARGVQPRATGETTGRTSGPWNRSSGGRVDTPRECIVVGRPPVLRRAEKDLGHRKSDDRCRRPCRCPS